MTASPLELELETPLAPELVRRAGYFLHLTRAIEDAGHALYLQGQVPGSFYGGRGQEATAVGMALAMGARDVASPLIRDLGVHLVRGMEPEVVFRHYLGRSGAPTEGSDGNVHLGSLALGTLTMVSHLPETLSVLLGVVLGRQLRGEPAAGIGFIGDGGANGGAFHETLNLAGVWRSPLVVVVERNEWSYMTRSSRMMACDEIVSRAAGYGMRAFKVDGNDVFAAYETASAALTLARAGEPVLIEARTFRMRGHGSHDGERYVPAEEREAWLAHDPLVLWQERARSSIGWSDDDQRELEVRIADEIATARERALAAPYPSADALASRVFAA